MANLPPGDPKLVSLIVNHLKSQGLFDQFRKDCLADVDTKPAYQNLRQRVDNFVSNHLASHTWSPHLNKNQLRNNIRQQVLKSGMLGSGIDRIISQVVDPKINHTFRPQVEKVVQEFLATLNNKEDANGNQERAEEKPECSVSVTGSASMIGPSTSVANDAMSILETISSLNQEATTAWALTDTSNHKITDKGPRKLLPQLSVDVSAERDFVIEEVQENERPVQETSYEAAKSIVKQEDVNEILPPTEDIKNAITETIGSIQIKEAPNDSDEKKPKVVERGEKKVEVSEKSERKEEKKETRAEKRNDHVKKSDDNARQKEEKPTKEKEAETEPLRHPAPEKSSKLKAADHVKEECASLDSDVDAFSDVTVSSVHTSDLSSFEEESEEEDAVSDSTEEGEITSDDEDKTDAENKAKSEQSETRTKGTRHAYVHKPYLYSKYYSDSDDELTVEQRRQSVAKEKEERLIRRQVKRERLEEKRKQRAAEKSKALKMKSQGMTSVPKSSKGTKPKSSSMKEVLKEQMFLEKKVAMSKKKKRDIRSSTSSLKIKSDYLDEDSRDTQKSSESQERASSSTRDSKSSSGKSDSKLSRKSLETADDGKTESRTEREYKKKTGSYIERTQDNDISDNRKLLERLDSTSEEQQRNRTSIRPEKQSKKEANDSDLKSTGRKDPKPHRNDRERTYSEERSSSKHKHKADNSHKQGSSDFESQRSKRSSKDDNLHKHSQSKSSSEERSDRKSKQKGEGKSSSSSKEDRTSDHSSKTDESVRERHRSTEKSRSENRYKRSSSDSKRRDSQSSSRSHSSSQKVSKTSADDKNEVDSANSDNSRQDDSVNKDKKRTHSCSEERAPTKSKLKSSSKSKPNDQEESTKKNEKDKVVVEGSTDKYRKSKSEDRDGDERRDSSVAPNSSSVAKESSHKSKHAMEKAKERSRHDSRDHGLSKLDKKYSGEKSSSLKHSHKDVKRKGDGSKSEEKSSKYADEKRKQERSSSTEKSSKKLSSELRGESSKGVPKKVSRSESDALPSSDAKDTERSRENKNGGKKQLEVTEKTATEAKAAEYLPASSLDNTVPPPGTETTTSNKTSAQKSKTKQGVLDAKDIKSSGAFKHTSKTSSQIDTDPYKESDLPETSSTDKAAEDKIIMPNTQSAIDVLEETDSELPPDNSRNPQSSNEDIAMPNVLESSAQEQRESTTEPHNIQPSSLSPDEIYSEVTDSNDGEISTSDLAEEEGASAKEAFRKESSIAMVPIDLSELDNLVTGNDVDGDISTMETETSQAEYSNESSAINDGFAVARDEFSVTVTCTERNVGSSVMEIRQGESSSNAHVYLGVDDQTAKEPECEDAATSSSSIVKNSQDDLRPSGEDTATSSSTPMDNSTDKSSPERGAGNYDNSREYTSSASADGNFVEDDGDFTMLSENSFEDATTSSSSDRKHCNEEHFLDPTISAVANIEAAATCSQSTSDVASETVGNITLKAATSSSANSGSSESAQDNAASSSYSAEENVLSLGVSNNVTHTATSSDTPVESVDSETVLAHVATSSESYCAGHISEHITTHAATSSSTAAENNGLGTSERHTATSSSNVINSSREMNFEASLVSSEIDGENAAASSSNVMDCSLADSNDIPLERESDNAASSSSSLPSRNKHNFNNVEDSKNTRATSSTQQDGVNDTCIDVISSGTLKEYPGNSSDLAMDSSTEVSVSIGNNLYTASAPSCSSSGQDQSPENNKYVEQRKEKDNTASSSSGHPLVLTPIVGDEAASSSSSFRKSSIQRRLEATLNSETTEAAASSSIAMNSRAERFDRSSPGNSTDTTATSSSNSTNSFTNLNPNTQPTESSSVVMDSSTGEDLNMRGETDMGNGTNSATSSGTLERVCEDQSIRSDRVPASSSTMVTDGTMQIVYADKLNEQTATSSNMMDSSIEDDKTCEVISNNNVYSTTSTVSDCEVVKDTSDFNTSSDVNSEATAATSSNTMEALLDNRDDNASSSDYVMDSSLEGILQSSGPSKNEEAASSSSVTDGGVQEIRMEASIDRPTVDDATTSSSTERENDLVVSDIDDAPNNETSHRSIEMAAESSFLSNHHQSATAGTSEEAALLHSGADDNDDHECVERESEDGGNDLLYDKAEEKEDAVSSASSEEQRHVTVSRPDMKQLGDGENDGVVTSAGTGARVSPITSEKSEASAHVTCADQEVRIDVSNIAAHHPVEDVAVSHTSGLDNNEGQVSDISVDIQAPEDPEEDASVENVVFEIIADVGMVNEAARPANQPLLEEGEGAVTSTGISEENDGGKVLGVIRRQNESVCASTESDENAIETLDSRAITEDDESAITSTGAKEDEEEGEGFVTSSGTAGEESTFSISVEHNSTSTIHSVDKHSDDTVVDHDEKTIDQQVEENLNGDLPENVTSFNVTPEVSLISTIDPGANEENPCVSVEIITVCDATASGTGVQSFKETHNSSEQGNSLDNVTELDNDSEEPQASENSSELIFLDDGTTTSKETPLVTEVECTSDIIHEIGSGDHAVSSEENLDDDQTQTASIDNTETAPTAVMDNPIALESSHESEDSSFDLQTTSDSTVLCPDESISEHLETSEALEASEERSITEPTEESLTATSNEALDDNRSTAPSAEAPLTDSSQPVTDANVQSLDDTDTSSTDKKTSENEESLTKPEDVEPGNKPEEDKDTTKEKTDESQSDINITEEPKVEPVKRKRGRPRKIRPPEADVPAVNKTETEVKPETSNSEKNPDTKPRRGRKRRIQSTSETGNMEPEKKRQKSESNEDDQGEDEEQEESENEDDDDIHKGATTRAASRLEAQRKLPHKPTTRAASKLSSPEKSSTDRRGKGKSPESKAGKSTKNKATTPQASGAKRRRDSSPQATRTRGQNTAEETTAKRIKRQ